MKGLAVSEWAAATGISRAQAYRMVARMPDDIKIRDDNSGMRLDSVLLNQWMLEAPAIRTRKRRRKNELGLSEAPLKRKPGDYYLRTFLVETSAQGEYNARWCGYLPDFNGLVEAESKADIEPKAIGLAIEELGRHWASGKGEKPVSLPLTKCKLHYLETHPTKGTQVSEATWSTFRLPHRAELALQIKRMRKLQGWRIQDVAKRLDISVAGYQRWEDPWHCNPTLATLVRLSKVFGQELEIKFLPEQP